MLLSACFAISLTSCKDLEDIKLYRIECEETCDLVRRDGDKVEERIYIPDAVEDDDYGAMTIEDILLLLELAQECQDKG